MSHIRYKTVAIVIFLLNQMLLSDKNVQFMLLYIIVQAHTFYYHISITYILYLVDKSCSLAL